MFEILFIILLFVVFGKLLGFAIKASWGITKVIFSLVVLPVVLIGLVVMGLIYIALPVLLIIGVISLLRSGR